MTTLTNNLSTAQANLIDHLKRQEVEYVVATRVILKMSTLKDVSSEGARSGMAALQKSLAQIRLLGAKVAQATEVYEREGLPRSPQLSEALEHQTQHLQAFLQQIENVKDVFSGVRDRMRPQLDGGVTRRAMQHAYQQSMKTG
ncbi:MAG: hypothetical protein GY903_34270 [Fuerstiella sp.]|nr:hypothetical protein [Fuerstiella sp.]MCP4859558.1 hypothetical protein [Fuerstiella sp.]